MHVINIVNAMGNEAMPTIWALCFTAVHGNMKEEKALFRSI